MAGHDRRRAAALRGIAVLAALSALAAGVFALPSTAGNKWSGNDFRLREVASSFGALSSSHVTVRGTMSRQARAAGLGPQVEFVVHVAIACHADGDPAHETTYPGAYRTRDPQAAEWSTTFSRVDAGSVQWTTTFDFVPPTITGQADGVSYEWCVGIGGASGAQVLDSVAVTGGDHGAAWLSEDWRSPIPGTSYYSFAIPGGTTAQRFQPKDGAVS